MAGVVAELDARLPGLEALFDAHGVAAALGSDVEACTLAGARYEPGVSCTATYAVRTRSGSRTFGVVEVTGDGRRVSWLEDDPGLPGLPTALDPAGASSLLAGRVEVRGVAVEPVRYRPGQRAVLRYDVDTGDGPPTFFAKVVSDGVASMAAACAHLHERAAAGEGPFVPAPVAVDERLQVLVLPAVEGGSLHRIVFDPTVALAARVDAFRLAGRAVARLHAGPPPPNTVVPADDVDELHRAAGALRAVDATLHERWRAVLDALARVEGTPPVAVASHGALRTDQILVTADGPALLDLDGFCAAPAARDLGNVVAYLRWRAMRRPEDAAVVTAGRDALLAGYEDEGGSVAAEALARFEALSLLKIAARRYRNLDVDEWPLAPELVDAAASLAGYAR